MYRSVLHPLDLNTGSDRSSIDGWTEFDVNEHVTDFVSREFNRIIVGAPTCRRVSSTARDANNDTRTLGRDPEYTKLITRYSVSVYVVSTIINLFPAFLRK